MWGETKTDLTGDLFEQFYQLQMLTNNDSFVLVLNALKDEWFKNIYLSDLVEQQKLVDELKWQLVCFQLQIFLFQRLQEAIAD